MDQTKQEINALATSVPVALFSGIFSWLGSMNFTVLSVVLGAILANFPWMFLSISRRLISALYFKITTLFYPPTSVPSLSPFPDEPQFETVSTIPVWVDKLHYFFVSNIAIHLTISFFVITLGLFTLKKVLPFTHTEITHKWYLAFVISFILINIISTVCFIVYRLGQIRM